MEKIKRHRNICHILDHGMDRRFGYLVMQSCSGGELFDRIANKNMTEQDAAIAVQDIIAALRYIHGKRIVHRDLKPENVLYKDKEPGSPLKLIDFGLAIHLAVRPSHRSPLDELISLYERDLRKMRPTTPQSSSPPAALFPPLIPPASSPFPCPC